MSIILDKKKIIHTLPHDAFITPCGSVLSGSRASTLPDCTIPPSSKKMYDTYVVIMDTP